MKLEIVESKWKKQVGHILRGESVAEMIDTLAIGAKLDPKTLRYFYEKDDMDRHRYSVLRGSNVVFVLCELPEHSVIQH